MNTNITLQSIMAQVEAATTPNEIKANEVINTIRNIIQKYVSDNKLKSLVIGVSGGLDSACVAALCQEKYTGVPLIGISIPMSSTNAHREQAEWVGKTFCSTFKEFSGWDSQIENIFNTLEDTNDIAIEAGFNCESFPTSVLKGNLKARMRMITLYDMARKTEGMVLSTDNLSEFQMGFWTICGDVGDFGPIQNIGKGYELPAIAKYLGVREDIISQPPSDGLMVTEDNTDEAQLGANYKEVDTIMGLKSDKNSPIIDDELRMELRDQMYSIDINSEDGKKIVKVLRRFESLEYKRNGTINLTRKEIGI